MLAAKNSHAISSCKFKPVLLIMQICETMYLLFPPNKNHQLHLRSRYYVHSFFIAKQITLQLMKIYIHLISIKHTINYAHCMQLVT